MYVDALVLRKLKYAFGKNLTVSRHHNTVRSKLFKKLKRLLSILALSERQRLIYGDTVLFGALLYGRCLHLLSSVLRLVGLSENSHDIMILV